MKTEKVEVRDIWPDTLFLAIIFFPFSRNRGKDFC